MSLTKYRAFLKIAKTGSFSDAAEQMHCTQSAVSRMIHDLENLWDIKLFSRYKSGVVLTPEGKSLFPLIQKVVIADNDVKASVSSFTHLMTGTVRIGSFASVASVWLPKVIKSFKKRYPEIRFEVLMGDFDEIEHWVKTGRVDFGFTSVGTSDDLQLIPLAKDELRLAVYESHRLAKLETVPVRLLEKEPFFLLSKGKSNFVSAYLDEHDVRPSIELVTFDDYAILNMVKMEFGIGILPELILQYPVEGIKIKKLTPKGFRSIRLVVRSEGKLSFVAQSFLQVFSQELTDVVNPGFMKELDPHLR